MYHHCTTRSFAASDATLGVVKLRTIAALLLATIGVAAQDRPGKLCTYDGFSTNPKLAEVAGDPLLVYRVEGAWTCGYLSQHGGAGPAWVRSAEIRLVQVDPNPPLAAWAGTWKGGEDRVTIQLSKTPGSLALKGAAVWRGRANAVHTGDFEGEGTPQGNHLHFVDSGTDSCTIDFTLVGAYIVADDNNKCGGMNVRFQGIWKRASR
jgi:hypothetical protein